MWLFILHILHILITIIQSSVKSRTDLVLENIALRHQLAAMKKSQPRPRLNNGDRFFWILLRRTWKVWREALLMVTPDTVTRWHRQGFRLFWKWKSRNRSNNENLFRKKEIRRLVREMALDNPGWGAPRIHGEMQWLGFRISERTVSRLMPKKKPRKSSQKWLAFLRNHSPRIAAMDFFTVPTLFFKTLYCFFVISHDRRRVIFFDATFHPTAEWVGKRLTSVFTRAHGFRYMIHDRGTSFSPAVIETLKTLGMESLRISFRSPWQNGIAERFVGSVRRELLDHVIVLNRSHIQRLMKEYLDYYHHDRTHYHLNKDSPFHRHMESKPSPESKVVALPRIGGLHHRYAWKKPA